MIAERPWLLVAGDPLPALPLAGRVWRAQAFAGSWAVVVIGDRLDAAALAQVHPEIAVLAIQSPASELAAGHAQDDGTASAQRLGALLAPSEVATVLVVLDPAGTVAQAQTGPLAQLVMAANAFVSKVLAGGTVGDRGG